MFCFIINSIYIFSRKCGWWISVVCCWGGVGETWSGAPSGRPKLVFVWMLCIYVLLFMFSYSCFFVLSSQDPSLSIISIDILYFNMYPLHRKSSLWLYLGLGIAFTYAANVLNVYYKNVYNCKCKYRINLLIDWLKLSNHPPEHVTNDQPTLLTRATGPTHR